jgi:hypothetical protein
MPLLAYVAIILVSLGGILFEVNWLTSPKLDTKAAVQASTTAPAKLAEATPAKSEAPIAPRSETAPPRNVAPTVTLVPAAASTTPVAAVPAAPQPIEPSNQQAGTAPAISPTPFGVANATTNIAANFSPGEPAAASTDFKREFTNDPKPKTTVGTAAAVTPAIAVSANNKCDVAHCSAAYQSFRASDCTFQPMEGPRKVCDRAPDTTQRAAAPARDMRVETVARRPGRDVELRAVERTVRRITAEEAGIDADMGRSEVIMIDRRDW